MNKNKEKDEEKAPEYDFKKDKKEQTIEQQIEDKLIEEERKRKKTDDVHILDIAKNPPVPGYMKVELKKAALTTKNEDDKEVTMQVLALPLEKTEGGVMKPPEDDPTVFVNADGDSVQVYDTIFDIDLKQMAEGQISDCASTIFPMLMDEYVQLALDEKKARQPEKRKEEFKWWWVLVLIMIIIPIILITVQVLPGLIG